MTPDCEDHSFGEDFTAVSGLDDFNCSGSFDSNNSRRIITDNDSDSHRGNFERASDMESSTFEGSHSRIFLDDINSSDLDPNPSLGSRDIGNLFTTDAPKQSTSSDTFQKLGNNETIRIGQSKRRKSSSDSITLKGKDKFSSKTIFKSSRSDGILMALKAKYRKGSPRHQLGRRNNMDSTYFGGRKSSKDLCATGLGGTGMIGRVNAAWYDDSGNQLSTKKSSSMHNLLLQSKVQSRSQTLLRESSAQSLSKRNSFQSLKSTDNKLDLSSLLPSGGRQRRRSSSRSIGFPQIPAGAFTTNIEKKTNFNDNPKPSIQKSINGATDTLLHDACRLFPDSDTVVETALRVDPEAVRRAVDSNGDEESSTSIESNVGMYCYPINLALTHGSNLKILNLLVQYGPDVLTFKDGVSCSASLGILLSSKRCDIGLVDLLLSANPKCAEIPDRRGNYPLHVAVSYGRSVEIIKRVHDAYPEAKNRRNFHCRSPIDISIQSTLCSEDVTDFLLSINCVTSNEPKMKNDNSGQVFGSLEDGLDDIMRTNY